MNSLRVAELYDQLHATEQKFRKNSLYPVHKKMAFTQPGVLDIYHWIVSQFEIPQSGHILDAGCGVGWGSLFLANHTEAEVTGISVSAVEINHAKKNVVSDTDVQNVAFSHQSYDNLESNRYDMIVAVESLKHSTDLGTTMAGLSSALTPNGLLVIVEDLFHGSHSLNAKMLCEDWQLVKAYNAHDYQAAAPELHLKQHDLTHWVPNKNRLLTALKMQLVNLLLTFNNGHKGWRAFRGGYCLERLYQKRLMTYEAMVFRKGEV